MDVAKGHRVRRAAKIETWSPIMPLQFSFGTLLGELSIEYPIVGDQSH